MITFGERKETMLEQYHIILASGSPRRQELLRGLELDFDVIIKKGISETYPEELQGGEIPLYIAKEKAAAYLEDMQANDLLITADTIVWKDGKVLGKPKTEGEAKAMISFLSGGTHQVYTGVCIRTKEKEDAFFVESTVKFANLPHEEIEHYVGKYKPLDKAGAYGIQEWIGYVGIEHIEGSYYNIMGLPVQKLWQHLKAFDQ